jgi:hypothetical protein
VQAELGPERWDDDVAGWVDRARRGTGVRGPHGSITAYWFGESSWGGPLAGKCVDKDDGKDKDKGNGNDNGNGNGNGGNGGGGGGGGGGGDDDATEGNSAPTGALTPIVPFLAVLPSRLRPGRPPYRRLTRT